MRRPQPQRGQAMVEMAIGSLIFTTVIVFGIHFAEVSYVAIRVEEAAAFAVYDTTGQRTHEKGNQNFALSSTIPGLSSSETKKKWGDFEANSGGNFANVKMSHVFTQFDKLYQGITCTKEPSLKYDTDPLAPVVPNPYGAGGPTGGVKCTASAEVSILPSFPRVYKSMKGFKTNQWDSADMTTSAASGKYKICATPRAVNGNCGDFGILVGDFSLQGVPESMSNDLFTGGNTDYYNLVDDAMGVTACPAAIALSMATAFTASPGACGYAMSYKGVEYNYKQDIGSAHNGPTIWVTGGTNSNRTVQNPETFLGVSR